MDNQYPSQAIQKYPTKIAFVIDCVGGLNGASLSSRFINNFPSNSDIFLFHPGNDREMNRRLKRIESDNHGVFIFSTSEEGIACSLSFLLGQISSKYDAFVVVTGCNPAFGDVCRQMIRLNQRLRNHIQVRSFERLHEFELFLRETVRLHNEDESQNKSERPPTTINYSRQHLFHACPFESQQESTILYRLGELLLHLDTAHSDVEYDFCRECHRLMEHPDANGFDAFETHLKSKHWRANGFQINIRPAPSS